MPLVIGKALARLAPRWSLSMERWLILERSMLFSWNRVSSSSKVNTASMPCSLASLFFAIQGPMKTIFKLGSFLRSILA